MDYRCKCSPGMDGERCQYLRALAVVEVIYSNLDNNEVSKDLSIARGLSDTV